MSSCRKKSEVHQSNFQISEKNMFHVVYPSSIVTGRPTQNYKPSQFFKYLYTFNLENYGYPGLKISVFAINEAPEQFDKE